MKNNTLSSQLIFAAFATASLMTSHAQAQGFGGAAVSIMESSEALGEADSQHQKSKPPVIQANHANQNASKPLRASASVITNAPLTVPTELVRPDISVCDHLSMNKTLCAQEITDAARLKVATLFSNTNATPDLFVKAGLKAEYAGKISKCLKGAFPDLPGPQKVQQVTFCLKQ